MNNTLIQRLSSILDELAKQAASTDKQNQQLKVHQYIKDAPMFSEHLFRVKSDSYYAYVTEAKKELQELERLLENKQTALASALIDNLNNQVLALLTALPANNTRHKNIAVTLDAKKSHYKKLKQAAKTVMQPTHKLYEKLAEHHEFERRLALMITEREYQREQAKKAKLTQLNQEILALHQRLGRCRKAISIIERDIELAEKRRH